MTTDIVVEPTAEAIATLDPDVDFEAAYAVGVTYTHRRTHILTFACPRPRCPARVGEHCTTPNGWSTNFHKERIDLAYGRTKPKPCKHRLTDSQAQRIEWAAEHGTYYAAGQHAHFGGDAAERAVADALLAHGYVEEAAVDGYGERCLRLTAEGWRTYWHHRLVIRRLPDGRHDTTCPCVTEETR